MLPWGILHSNCMLILTCALWPRTTGRITSGIHPPGRSAARVQEEQHLPDEEAGVRQVCLLEAQNCPLCVCDTSLPWLKGRWIVHAALKLRVPVWWHSFNFKHYNQTSSRYSDIEVRYVSCAKSNLNCSVFIMLRSELTSVRKSLVNKVL